MRNLPNLSAQIDEDKIFKIINKNGVTIVNIRHSATLLNFLRGSKTFGESKNLRKLITKKITKDIPKADLSMARKKEIEKRLEKPAFKNRIDRIARKSLPKVRRAEIEKKRGSKNKEGIK